MLGILCLAWVYASLSCLKVGRWHIDPGLRSLQCKIQVPNCSTCQAALEKCVETWQYINREIICLPCWLRPLLLLWWFQITESFRRKSTGKGVLLTYEI